MDQLGIHALYVCQYEKLFNRGMVSDVAFLVWIRTPPLGGGVPEQGDIQQIRFTGVGFRRLGWSHLRWEQMLMDGIGLDAVVELRQGSIQIPGKRETHVFGLFEALKFLYQKQLEFNLNPRGEFEGDVLMGKGTAVTTRSGHQTNRTGSRHPLFGS